MPSSTPKFGSASLKELMSTWYYAADPTKYVVKTGIGIDDMHVMKSGWKYILQNATLIDISPHNYEFQLHAMSSETLPFTLPGVFTIGPDISEYGECYADEIENNKKDIELVEVDAKTITKSMRLKTQDEVKARNIKNIKKYARFLASNDSQLRDNIIRGIIEGETRVLAATMKIKELFSDRVKFKENIIEKINEELRQFGLVTRNANLRELSDTDGSNYFQNTKKQVLATAENQAKIDVANAVFTGDTESKKKDTDRVVKLNELTVLQETKIKELDKNKRQQIAQYEVEAALKEKEQESLRRQQIAQYDADAICKENEQDKNKRLKIADYNTIATLAELEQESKRRQQAAEFSAKAISVENSQKELITKSDAGLLILKAQQDKAVREANLTTEKEVELQNVQLEERNNLAKAKAMLEQLRATQVVKAQADAEIIKTMTDAEVYAKKNKADAMYYEKMKEAEGIKAHNEASAFRIKKLVEAFNGDTQAVVSTLMVENKVFTEVAEANAKAIQGLNPKITQWNTTSDGTGVTDLIRNVAQFIPPLFKTFEQQTGMKLLPNLGIVSQSNDEVVQEVSIDAK